MVEQHYQELGSNLTSKQRKFVQYYIETGSAPEAAMRAYNCSSRNSARVIAHRNLHKPKIIAYIERLWSEHNLLEQTAQALGESLRATKVVITNRRTGEGMEVPDHAIRLDTAKIVLKVRGVY